MQVACPSCQKRLKVPDSAAGKKVKCPGCGSIFAALQEALEITEHAAAPPPLPAGKKEEDDRSRRRREAEEEETPARRERRSRFEESEEGIRTTRKDRPSARDEEEAEEPDRPSRRRRSRADDDEDDDRPRRRRSRAEDEDEDQDDSEDREEQREKVRKRARRRAKAAAVWFVLAGISAIVLFVLNVGGNLLVSATMGAPAPPPGKEAFESGRKVGQVAGMFFCGAIAIGGAIAEFQAGASLKSLRGRGKVVTAAVFGFVLAVFFGIVFVLNIGALSAAAALPGVAIPAGLKLLVLSQIVVAGLATILNAVAGIMGIVTLNNVDVSRAFRRSR